MCGTAMCGTAHARLDGVLAGGVSRELIGAPHPVLTTQTLPVDAADPLVVAGAADLLATMRRSHRCTGLSAPQIGLGWRLLSLDVSRHPRTRSCAGELVVANPRLVAASRWERVREGCLSVPGLTGEVSRATRITVRGEHPGSGTPVTVHADAFEARCLQHQLDHLDGVLFLDRVVGARAVHRTGRGSGATGDMTSYARVFRYV
ncbi:peptide deformylase [Planomonospora venezuelensis]|uniref:Peptide deformylase-like n=1 Tax=Planomonospora venezuelensis TaxID=1999 RepID=A0A841D2K5_PLAVE|nr:peptide deformylase [Planomonospora venezuelensis]MBB5962744.1 peptide deformylase [Planomonospora venezuelensis]GIM99460.1 peptide deformylase [Planomonospora venezuelensis]